MGGHQTKLFLLQLLDVFNKFSVIKNLSMSVSMKMAETISCDDPVWVIDGAGSGSGFEDRIRCLLTSSGFLRSHRLRDSVSAPGVAAVGFAELLLGQAVIGVVLV